ncbi:hypothetical protein D039_0617, partial [Vibrio parahaemolyticus EKP-028]|jgi:hypothetical protein
MLWE